LAYESPKNAISALSETTPTITMKRTKSVTLIGVLIVLPPSSTWTSKSAKTPMVKVLISECQACLYPRSPPSASTKSIRKASEKKKIEVDTSTMKPTMSITFCISTITSQPVSSKPCSSCAERINIRIAEHASSPFTCTCPSSIAPPAASSAMA
jgi:hypothetical protein